MVPHTFMQYKDTVLRLMYQSADDLELLQQLARFATLAYTDLVFKFAHLYQLPLHKFRGGN